MDAEALQQALARQRRAFAADGFPDAHTRIERLDRMAAMVLAHAEEIVAALSLDFGNRSPHATRTGDVLGAVAAIRYNRDNLSRWMAPTPIALPEPMEREGARAEVRCQPLGVIGAIVPWNGPVLMGVLAAAGALAAGNRLMLKVPELTPRASVLLERMFAGSFAPEEVCVVQGDVATGAAFSRLRFDHLLFTGSLATARHVARAAAEQLVPVTLELGGRNPVIVGRSADIELAAARLVTGKMASAGQVCVSPDYVLVPRGSVQAMVDAMAAQAARLYPTLLDNDDYTAIASPAHFARLRRLLEDARLKGARVLEINPAGEAVWDSAQRKFPLCLLTGVTPDMRVLQEESFGPLLCILPYDSLEEALAVVAEQPSPLSAYYFGSDPVEQESVVERVVAGNMVVNDVRCQLFFEQLPFGGVGASGMGRYRGHEGFKTFSNAKTVVHQMPGDALLAQQRPPFSEASRDAVKAQVAALSPHF
ncbi:aldehyde dehydrogenase family protein [Variovorax terrae]|uniref:Aldehyde dehydrogenase n=1 Tax=Variovorax terrae TaxID=2923278 RepID=A0A9X1W016_9BURK|nr:aldehyde dehydrogenase family protein [Variovorax terrae]MCJ0763598.1 aldehyde dehydrogenase family protein [Variovorax terrae]